MGRIPPPGQGKPGFNIAIITIVALHVVFFGGLLLQGCGRGGKDEAPPLTASTTNLPPFPDSLTGLGQPYAETTNLAGLTTAGGSLTFTSSAPAAPRDTTPTNLSFVPLPERAPDITPFPRTEVVEPTPAPAPGPMKEYKIVRGDTPSAIARKNGITLDQLREANPDMRDRELRVGQPLQIPPAARETAALGGRADAVPAGVTVYEVKAGDNLTKIARAHGTTVKAIRSFNNLKTDRIVVKQRLRIPAAETNTPATAPRL